MDASSFTALQHGSDSYCYDFYQLEMFVLCEIVEFRGISFQLLFVRPLMIMMYKYLI